MSHGVVTGPEAIGRRIARRAHSGSAANPVFGRNTTARANMMVRRLCARALIVLGLLPFTAPFSTFDTSDLGGHRAVIRTTAALACVPIEAADSAGSIVPTLLTKSGRLRIDLSPQCEGESVRLAPSLSIAAWMKKPAGLPGRRALPANPLQLRL